MPAAFYIVFGACFTGAVAWALGRLMFHRLRLQLFRGEEHALAFMTGSAVLSLLMFALAAAHGVRKGVLLALGSALLIWVFRSGAHKSTGTAAASLPRTWRLVLAAAFLSFGLLYLTNAMAPEMSPDGSAYHLRFVADYHRAHGFVRITTNLYANLSQGLELLFLFAYVFGRHSSAAMVHLLFLFALAWLMICWGRRRGRPQVGAAAALFTFMSPVIGVDGISAYNDVAVAAVVFTVFYFLDIWREQRQLPWLMAAGLMAGFAYAIKYTAFVAVPYALAVVAWNSWRARQNWWRPARLVGLSALLMIAPWLAKNAIWVDNPFAPFMNKWFPNPYTHVDFEETYKYHMRHYIGIESYRQLPLELTVRGGALGGFLGPLFLLAPLGLLAARHADGRRVLVAAAVFGSTYFTNIGTRFLIPAAPLLSLAMAMALSRPPWLNLALIALHAALSWPPVARKYCAPYAWRLNGILYRQALRLEKEEHFLERALPGYRIARMLESSVPPGGVVLSMNQLAEAYTTRTILVSFQAAWNRLLNDMLQHALAPEIPPTWRHTFRFPAQQFQRLRVVQTARGAPDVWSVTEVRYFAGDRELARASGWRLRAWPNPWDVTLAFDNSPVTRWRSWRKIEPGMFLETDFGRPEKLDAVRVELSRDQYQVRMRVEGIDSHGRWITLSSQPEITDVTIPRGLRRLAIAELKARGVTHLLIWDEDFGAEDFRLNAALWGVSLVRTLGPVRLYQLN